MLDGYPGDSESPGGYHRSLRIVGRRSSATGRLAIKTYRSPSRMPDSPPEPVYANVVDITVGPFDMVIDFGFKSPEQTKRQSADYEVVARVAMSLAHAKAMLPLLARIIAKYEQQVGPITAPGFDDSAKE
jgi:hypothetical protein